MLLWLFVDVATGTFLIKLDLSKSGYWLEKGGVMLYPTTRHAIPRYRESRREERVGVREC